jgi:hypothetical protein
LSQVRVIIINPTTQHHEHAINIIHDVVDVAARRPYTHSPSEGEY